MRVEVAALPNRGSPIEFHLWYLLLSLTLNSLCQPSFQEYHKHYRQSGELSSMMEMEGNTLAHALRGRGVCLRGDLICVAYNGWSLSCGNISSLKSFCWSSFWRVAWRGKKGGERDGEGGESDEEDSCVSPSSGKAAGASLPLTLPSSSLLL